MNEDALSCRCGKVRGVLRGTPAAVAAHVVCYCTDCRAFARHLGREDVLDA